MRKIAIRIDDITPEMDWQKFSRFTQLLDRFEICPLIGVVPKNQDPELIVEPGRRNHEWKDVSDFAGWLRERQDAGWVIAVHGYYHKYSTQNGGLFPLNRYSEYAGLSAEIQKNMLREGRQRLQEWGADTDIFMAPAHSYDRATLKALKECGYRYVTDGFGDRPYEREGLVFLPISFLKSRSLKAKSGVTTFVVHTWNMEEKEFRWYEQLLETDRERFINYRELLLMEARPRGAFGNAKEHLMASGKHMVSAMRGGGR